MIHLARTLHKWLQSANPHQSRNGGKAVKPGSVDVRFKEQDPLCLSTGALLDLPCINKNLTIFV